MSETVAMVEVERERKVVVDTDRTVANVEQKVERNIAVDAYRGLVMVLMMAEVLEFRYVHRNFFPNNPIWWFLDMNQNHSEWAGMSLHDTIQPAFTFLVGVALPYSVRSRLKKGATFPRMLVHTMWRSLVLIALGVFLSSTHSTMTNFAFTDTLSQIGLGYTFAFLLTFVRPRWQWTAFGAILFGYWLAWALYPAPGPGFDYAAVGVPTGWNHLYTGFLSHWNKNSNLGSAFDIWFLNLFPRSSRFLFARGGYQVLNFIPTLGTMLLGVFAGRWFLSSVAEDSDAQVSRCRGRFDRGGTAASLRRSLPDCEAHLDALVGAVQRGYMLPFSGGIFVDRRYQEASRHCVSAGGCGHELDCGLRHGGVVQGIL